MKSINPKVTVYITNYNYGKYIIKAIESVLDQSLQNFEILIIDDGSTDESIEILKSYDDNPKINIIKQNNKGLTISNNVALKIAKGKYIMRLDADDFLFKYSLETLSIELDKDPEIGMVFGDYYTIDEHENIIEHFQRHDFNKDVSLFDQPAHGACTMFRIECLRQLGGYDETIRRQDGYELWLRFIEKYKVTNINKPIFYYRQHDKNLTSKEDKLLNTRTQILKNHVIKNNKKKLNGIAILPIRGSYIDNRSLPFTEIGGEKLIDRSINFILEFNPISKLIVTTPDSKVLNYVDKKWKSKIELIERPKKISLINSPLSPVIKHAFEASRNAYDFDYFMVQNIEAPFKKPKIIESGINIMQIFDVDTVVGLRPERDLLFNHNGKGMQFILEQGSFRLERNEIYKMVSGYLVREMKSFRKGSELFGDRIGHVIFDQISAYNIRNELDLSIANYLAQNNKYN